MSMTPQSALVWLVDEAQTILTSLAQTLEKVKGVLDASNKEHCASLLATCEEKIHSVEGAFNVADSQGLTQYASALSQVLRHWRESKAELTIDSIAQFQMACWSLYDFLKIAKDRSDYSVLSLFLPYQQLGGLLQANHHPIQLWGESAVQSALAAWTQSNVTESFMQKMTNLPKSNISANDLNDQIDTAMLGLIRSKSADAAAQLQTLFGKRVDAHTAPNQILFGATLAAVANAVNQQYLNLDIFLKRYLLDCMAWLKGEASDEQRLLNEAAFFCYLAWQKAQPTAPDDLAYLAQLAAWSPAQATSYDVMHFRPEVRSQMLLAHGSIEASEKLWGAFCTSDTASISTAQLVDLSTAFNAMGACLDKLHPAAYALNQSLLKTLSDADQRKNRDMQVEVASTLLMLSSLTADATSGDDLKIEQCFDDLNRRLNALSRGQAAGAFEPWMAELQQRKNWASAMDSSVEHLTHKLGEVENIFNHLWEHPDETAALEVVPEKLQQISSVALSLGLNPFAAGVDAVKAKVTKFANKNTVMERHVREQVTADLAALGLMLSMGQHDTPLPMIEATPDDEDEPMLDIFLEEAAEVIQTGLSAIENLSQNPAGRDAIDTLTRSFHTLKGSARIVGLSEFGEASWLMEKYLNDTALDGLAIAAPSLQLCARQLGVMKVWAQELQTQKTIDAADIHWGLEALALEIQELNQPPQIEPHQMPSFVLPPADFLDLPASSPTIVPLPEAEIETQLKTVGDLQISIPLYQAYLNETDEWSRQLALALSEWAIDDRQPIPSQALAWAHALSGSSATIGFASCAHLAKLVERLIEKIQTQNFRHTTLAKDLSLAAEDVRRLLHQFAAGFVKEVDPLLFARMEDYFAMPVLEAPAAQVEQAVQVQQVAPDTEMLAVFQEESEQLIPELGAALRAWERSPSLLDHKTQALRVLHTLKGSARLVGEQVLAQKAHDLESQIEAIGGMPSAAHLSKLLGSYDQLLEQPKKPALAATQFVSAVPQPVRAPVVATASNVETIRIQSSIIDRLVNQTGEIMTARARMETEMSRSLRTLSDLSVQVQRLRDQLRELELQTESQMQSRQAQVSDAANVFDPLELDRFTRTQELTRFMAEALGDVSSMQRSLQRSLNTTEDDLAAQLRQTRDLQRHLLRTRMVEFESISERLHRLVRMTSLELGKSVELTIQNSAQEIDRSVLERVLPAFEHILRNAVVHGIESPKDREAKGKLLQGKINIELSQQSNDVMVVLRDDGRGLDKEALIAKAKKLQPSLDPNIDPADLIFMSGLSTAVQVSELAGRGIGLDVVRAQVQALGGRVQVQFAKDTGTAFKLILPLTMAVTQIVLIRTAAVMTGIPSNLVVNVVRAKLTDVNEAYASGEFKSGAQAYPFYGLNQLLQYKASAIDSDQATLPVMLLQSAGQIVAVHVDEVIGNQEVMIKNLGTQLAQMPALSGMTVLPAGEIVLIYNPVALAAVYGVKTEPTQKPEVGAAQAVQPPVLIETNAGKFVPLVLVVDDSITMRRVLQRLLQREGYRVTLAADGKQALESLRLEKPALVLSDVEMPRMDGFELLQNIRGSDRLRDIPVVMITSRIADKHREHAKTLGANEYLGKPYSEDELIAVLTRYAKK
jgi:chemosensory pili system protein ChpA (sensor histidine kinase/response regulator)